MQNYWWFIFYVKFLTGKPDNSIGYNYRRLIDNVPTGIYECNTGCKCKSTCLNRVAQVNIGRSLFHPYHIKVLILESDESKDLELSYTLLHVESNASSSSSVQNWTPWMGHTNSQWYSSWRLYLYLRWKFVQQWSSK